MNKIKEISELKEYYKSGRDSIGKDLLTPCLKNCISWRRSTLGFSSSALKAWAGSFVNIVENVEKIEILADISHVRVTDKRLMGALEHTSTPEEKRKALFKYGERVILTAIQADTTNDSAKLNKEYIWKLLHYLLASEKLEIRFAVNTITESGSKGSKLFLLKWGFSINFFKKHFLKSDTKYTGPLGEPFRNFSFYLELLICKFYFFYLKLFFKS